jgi:hypothetical protein
VLAGGRHGFYYPECKELFYFAGLRQVGAGAIVCSGCAAVLT